jgi:hypothetical protein
LLAKCIPLNREQASPRNSAAKLSRPDSTPDWSMKQPLPSNIISHYCTNHHVLHNDRCNAYATPYTACAEAPPPPRLPPRRRNKKNALYTAGPFRYINPEALLRLKILLLGALSRTSVLASTTMPSPLTSSFASAAANSNPDGTGSRRVDATGNGEWLVQKGSIILETSRYQ